jgi:hypothetical protein
MAGLAIDDESFESGEWITLLPELLELKTPSAPRLNGANEVAKFILNLLKIF